jgi:hypothetical protein
MVLRPLVRGLDTPAGNGHGVREESHLDDMRAAIRGDFERLAERRGEQVVLRVRERPEIEALGADPAPAEAEGCRPKRSWIDRLLGL